MNQSALRIYAGHRPASGPARPTRPRPTPRNSNTATPSSAAIDSIGDRIRAVFERPDQFGESVHDAFTRKERELREIFASLAPDAARSLHHRLSLQRPGDRAAEYLARLVAERRSRLFAVLATVAR